MADGGTSMKEIGWRIRILREALGYKKATAFAAWVGLSSPQQLSNYERGRKRIELSLAIMICRKTHVTLDWIYRGERAGLPLHLAEAIQTRLDQSADISAA